MSMLPPDPDSKTVLPSLRDQIARKLFHEFVTGELAAWDKTDWQNAHYRTECYRVTHELLDTVRGDH